MYCFLSWQLIFIILFGLFTFVYCVSKIKFRNFSKYGVKYLEPSPLFGNLLWSILGVTHLSTIIKNIYDSFPTERYVAIFEFLTPTILIKDQELIKKVTIKDFDHFHDIPFQIDENIDPIFGRVLLALKGEKWHQMRSALSPAFTAFKMRNMYSFMKECAGKVIQFYQMEVNANPNLEVEVKDIASRFTVDVIASTAFSFEVDSLKDRDNKFFQECCTLSVPTIKLMLKFTGFRVFPKLMKMLGIRLMSEDTMSFFRILISDTLKQRETNGIKRFDMLHLLLEAKIGKLKHEEEKEGYSQFATVEESSVKKKETNNINWTDDDLIAQAIVFILAGHQTTSTLFSFLIYELAINMDVQDKLRREVDDLLENNGGSVTYNDLLQMKYMDMVVSECFRKWPPIPFINRLCVQDYDLGPVREGATDHIEVKKGETVWIPVHSIHMDPLLWPDPDKFDPERFSPDNVTNIKPHSFLIFGSGPRSCIGSRFALLNIKVMLFHLISRFQFEPCSKTIIPLQINPKTLFLESKNGYWVAMKSRSEQIK